MTNGGEICGRPGLELTIIWLDEDMLEFRALVSNGRFAGTAEFYTAHDAATRLADALDGFPTSPFDRREAQFGMRPSDASRAGLRLGFRCVDAAGHIGIDVQLQAARDDDATPPESVRLTLPMEATSIDAFVRDLRAMKRSVGQRARLRIAT